MDVTTDHLPTVLEQINGHKLVTLDERQDHALPMPIQVDLVVNRVRAVQEIVSKVFKEDVHFGKIPGTGDKKTLLKPGFDVLCLAFQFSPEFIKQPASIESDKMINLIYKCNLIHTPTGRIIASGDGSCNSKEEKYRWTTTARKCPSCNAEAIIMGKPEYEKDPAFKGGYVCYGKKGGCGAKFKKGDPTIEAQQAGRVENDNPWNFHNTLTKMAQKRAGVGTVITACGLSGDFTQDMEDFEPQAHDKSRRDEPNMPPIDIQANREPERPYYTEESGGGYDQKDAAGAGPTNEQMDLRPSGEDPNPPATAKPVNEFGVDMPPPNVTPEVAKAYTNVAKELLYCKTREDFNRLKAYMIAGGEEYLHPQVKTLFNSKYHQFFPKTETKGAK